MPEIQTGEDHLTFVHQLELKVERILHLENQIAALPYLGGLGLGRRARRAEDVVPGGATDTRTGLQHGFVSALNERRHARRRDRHTAFVGLDFPGDAEAHTRRSHRRAARRR